MGEGARDNRGLVARGCCSPIHATIRYWGVGVEATVAGGGFFTGDHGVSATPCVRGLDLTCRVMGCSSAPATYDLADVRVGGV